jgi:hypothetical protein
MEGENTTAAVQRYLDEWTSPDGDAASEPVVRAFPGCIGISQVRPNL